MATSTNPFAKRGRVDRFFSTVFLVVVIPIGLTKAVAAESFTEAFIYAAVSLVLLEFNIFIAKQAVIGDAAPGISAAGTPARRDILVRFGFLLVYELALNAVARQFASDGKDGLRQIMIGGTVVFHVFACLMGHLASRTLLTVTADRVILQNKFRRETVPRMLVTRVHVPAGEMPPVPFLVLQDGTRKRVDAFAFLPRIMGFSGLRREDLRKLEETLQVPSDANLEEQPSAPPPISELPTERPSNPWPLSPKVERPLRRYVRRRVAGSAVLAFLGLSVLLVAGEGFRDLQRYKQFGPSVQGSIVGTDSDCSHVRVRFATLEGETREASAPVFDCKSYTAGQLVQVVYDPRNPALIRLTNEFQTVVFQFALGFAFVLAAAVLARRTLRWAKRVREVARLSSSSRMRGEIRPEPRRFLGFALPSKRSTLWLYPTDSPDAEPHAIVPLLAGQVPDGVSMPLSVEVKGVNEGDSVLVARTNEIILWPQRSA